MKTYLNQPQLKFQCGNFVQLCFPRSKVDREKKSFSLLKKGNYEQRKKNVHEFNANVLTTFSLTPDCVT